MSRHYVRREPWWVERSGGGEWRDIAVASPESLERVVAGAAGAVPVSSSSRWLRRFGASLAAAAYLFLTSCTANGVAAPTATRVPPVPTRPVATAIATATVLPSPTPPAIATATATAVPLAVVSETAFRQGLDYVLSQERFAATMDNNKVLNVTSNFLYYQLTGVDPAQEVYSFVLPKEDMDALWPGFNVAGFSLPLEQISPERRAILERYGLPRFVRAKYATLVLGGVPGVAGGRNGLTVLLVDAHERGHARDFLYGAPYTPGGLDDPGAPDVANGLGYMRLGESGLEFVPYTSADYQSALIESIANTFEAAAARLVQRFTSFNILAYADTEENRRHIDIKTDPSTPDLEQMLPWLAVLGDPQLSGLADELRQQNALSPASAFALHEHLVDIPVLERDNYAYGLFSLPNYPALMAEIKSLATARLQPVSAVDQPVLHGSIVAALFTP